MNNFFAFPKGKTSMERSFSYLKMIKTRLCSHQSDFNVAQLMNIWIEGTKIDAVEFEDIMEFFEEHNHRIQL